MKIGVSKIKMVNVINATVGSGKVFDPARGSHWWKVSDEQLSETVFIITPQAIDS